MTNDQVFVEEVVKSIVEDKEAVSVSREVDDKGVLLTLKVGKDDMGRIIGKEGKTVSAIRTLLRVVGSQNDDPNEQRVNLKVFDPEEGMERNEAPEEAEKAPEEAPKDESGEAPKEESGLMDEDGEIALSVIFNQE